MSLNIITPCSWSLCRWYYYACRRGQGLRLRTFRFRELCVVYMPLRSIDSSL